LLLHAALDALDEAGDEPERGELSEPEVRETKAA
jgi:hypothetical protein